MSEMIERNCNKCIHHTSGMCDSWDCKMQTVEDVKKEAVNEYVKAVVEELEDRVNEANNNCLCEMHENGHTLDFENENGRIKGLKEAIEIVKQGGLSDDVCEWKKDDMCETVYSVCCGCFTSAYQKDFKFCPYCGKKIKVVE